MFPGQRYARHLYSRGAEPWNADESLMLLTQEDGRMYVLNGQDYSYIGSPTDLGLNWWAAPHWDRTDPNKLWGLDLWAGEAMIIEMTINPTTLVRTYRNISVGTGYTLVSQGGGEGSFSNDGRYNALLLKKASGLDLKVFDYVTETVVSTLAIPDPSTIGTDVDWAGMSQSGLYVVVAYNTAGAGFKYEIYDRATLTLQRTLTPADGALGHADLGYDIAGHEVLVYVDSGVLKTYRLSDGTIENHLSSDHIAYNFHISCRNIDRPGYAYYSTFYLFGSSSTKWMYWEVFSVKLDGSGLVERWSQTFRADSPTDMGYPRQAQAVPSRDGQRVLFASDWGDASGSAVVNDYIAEMVPVVASSGDLPVSGALSLGWSLGI
jgi:hypothetical protein